MACHRSVALGALLTVTTGTVVAKERHDPSTSSHQSHRLATHPVPHELCQHSLRIAKASFCPAPLWNQMIAPVLATEKMVYVNVGANKGYNVNSFLMQYHRGWNVTNAQWKSMVAGGDCGVCKGCNDPGAVRTLIRKTSAQVIAVEMLSDNAAQLQRIFEAFQVPGKVVHAAGGESVGETYEPRRQQPSFWNLWNLLSPYGGSFDKPGVEGVSVIDDPSKGLRVEQVTVDHIIQTYGLEKIDILSIDTEGHDDGVIRGADKALASQNIRVVEFEYHEKGQWATRSIHGTIDFLKKHHYQCFWSGVQGELSPFLNGCNYDFKSWSNVVCSHDPQVLQIFHMLVPEPFRPYSVA